MDIEVEWTSRAAAERHAPLVVEMELKCVCVHTDQAGSFSFFRYPELLQPSQPQNWQSIYPPTFLLSNRCISGQIISQWWGGSKVKHVPTRLFIGYCKGEWLGPALCSRRISSKAVWAVKEIVGITRLRKVSSAAWSKNAYSGATIRADMKHSKIFWTIYRYFITKIACIRIWDTKAQISMKRKCWN